MINLSLGVVAGFLYATQTGINADLRKSVGSPVRAALVAYVIGMIVMMLLTVITGSSIVISHKMFFSSPWWLFTGGIFGSIYQVSNIFLFKKIGAIKVVILPIMGQLVFSSIIGQFGWLGAATYQLSFIRVIGFAVLAFGWYVAIVLVQRDEDGVKVQAKSQQNLGWEIWSVLSGGLFAAQQIINGQLGHVVGSPVKAAYISFLVSTILLVIVALVTERKILPNKGTIAQTKWWSWTGGISAGLVIALGSVISQAVGASLTLTLIFMGQYLGSSLIQQFGLWRSPKNAVLPLQIYGFVVILMGVVIIRFW
ncbi:DMT family transporter [Periweissella cryptocerci]|uniref:DMT family transporter n=1 Tax=Periweissella cryptocerci TaxID=2506420 RepID=A0A4P6YTK9_9LACO|nr:DMT family transporter [Periweissella cryptocerci]QBO36099.1 DMT family transporter [Periweissella cryptocerci]